LPILYLFESLIYSNVNITQSKDTIFASLSYLNDSEKFGGSIKYFSPDHFKCNELEFQIENEAADLSRNWVKHIEKEKNSPFIYKDYNLSIPVIHAMGIGWSPESFFHCAVRGLRFTQRILQIIKPNSVVLINDSSAAMVGAMVAVDDENNKRGLNYNIKEMPQPSNKMRFFYLKNIKPTLRIGRDITVITKNKIFKKKECLPIKNKIVYFPIWYNRYRLMKPVLDELLKKNYQVRIITGRKDRHKGEMVKTLNSSIIPYYFYDNYISIRGIKNIINKKNMSIMKFHINDTEIESDPLLSNLMVKLQFNAIDNYKINHHYNFLYIVELIESIIHKEKPKLFLFNTDEASIGKIASIVCKEYNIPTMSLDHGLQIDSPRISDLLFDRMAVSGLLNKELFVKNGASEDQIHITGMPIHDKIFNVNNSSKNYGFIDELNPSNKTILLLTHPFSRVNSRKMRKETLENVIKTITDLSNINLIIKKHPNETDKFIERELNLFNLKNYIILNDVNKLYEIISFSDIVITIFNSTSAIEAVLFDKPVLIVNLSGQNNSLELANEGIAIEVTRPIDIQPSIIKMFDKNYLSILKDKRKEFIKRYAYKLDGKSTRRVVDVVQELVESKKNIN